MSYKPSPQRKALAVATVLAFASTPKPSWSNPTGGQVVGGSATISTPGASSMVIDQTSGKAIINWNSFSIGAGESVRFNQPSASSIALNRVLGNTRSEIFGSLTANGQIFLVNPNGVLMARGAEVSASGFLASSLGITDGDFLAGRYSFTRGAIAGPVINEGSILTPGGHTALLAPNIVNNGLIAARLGSVALAAGDRVTLDFHGDGLLRVTVDEATLTAAIKNSGSITADGGQVILTAKSANALLDTVLNNEGVIRADTLVDRNGVIALESSSGITSNSGSLLARGQNAGGTGGTVSVTSPNVLLTSTAVADASGMAGGGNVFIGGNWQGQGPLANAQNTYVAQGAQLKADAQHIGNGGEIVVWADNATRFYGDISARGGANGGNGGNAEVSGRRYLDFQGTTDLRASQGQTGSLLLDPANITIDANADTPVFCAPFCPGIFLYSTDNSTLNVTTLVNALANASVAVDAVGSPAPTAEGKIIVDAPILTNVSAGTVLVLKAQTSIILNKSIALGAGTLDLISVGGGLIQQTAGAGGITANTLNISNVNNSAILNEANNVANLGAVNLGAGVLTLNNATGLTVIGAVTGVGANLTTAGPLSIANKIDVGFGNINLTTTGAGPITQSGSGALVANAGNLTVTTANSAVTLTPQGAAVNDIGTLNTVNTGNGAFTYTGNGSQNTLTVSGGTAGSLIVTNNNTVSITGVINVVNDIVARSVNKNVNATPALVTSTAGGITIRANEDISLQGQFKAQDATKGNITLISDSKSITLAKDFLIGNTLTVQAGPGQTLELANIVTNSTTKQIDAKNVSLIADTLDFTNFTSATGTGTLSIAPRSAGNPMDIGTVGALTLNQNNLNTMSSFGTIDLGRTGSLALPASTDTAGAINLGSANIINANLNLFSNGSDNTKNIITQGGALLLGGGMGTLGVVTAGGNVSMPDSGNTIGTLGVVNTGKGVFNFNDSAGGLVVTGPVSVTGLAITTKDGDLQIKGAITDSGNSSLTNTTDSIIQTAGAPIANSDLTINAAKAITLTDTNNNLKGEVKITNTGANIVAITNSGGLSLGTSSVGTGTLTLTALGGAITQSSSSASFKQTTGASAATFNAGANPITLTNAANDFTSTVTAIGTNVSLNDANALTAVVNSIGTNVINGGGPLNISGTLTNLSSTATIGGSGITATSSAPTFTVTGLTTNNGAANLTSNHLVIAGNGALGTGVLTTNGAAQTLQSGAITAGAYTLAGGAMTLAGGSMTLTGPLTVSPATLLTGGATVVNGPTANVFGTFNLGGTGSTTLTNTNVLAGGLLTGMGTLTGNLNSSGTVAPGNSPGMINVVGNFTQGAAGVLNIEVGGTTAGTGYDRIAVTGNAVLDGTLNVLQFGGYVPAPPERFQIITTTGTSTGVFTTVNRAPFAAFTALAVNYPSTFTELFFPSAQVPVPIDVIVGATAAPAGTVTPLFITSDRGPACLVGDVALLFYPKGAPIAAPK